MQSIFARSNSRTLQRLKCLRQEAQSDKAPRVALRLQAIMLSVQRLTTGQIAQDLRELEKSDADAADGQAEQAIDQYRKASKHALQLRLHLKYNVSVD